MRLFTFLAIFLILFETYAQDRAIIFLDSISAITPKPGDKERLTITYDYLSKYPDVFSEGDLGMIYHKLGLWHQNLGDYEAAIAQTSKAISYKRHLAPLDVKSLNNSRYNLFLYYKSLGRTFEGLHFLEDITRSNTTDKFLYKSYIALAAVYRDKGDYFTALEYLKLVTDYDMCKDARTLRDAHLESILLYRRMENPQLYVEEVLRSRQILEQLTSPKYLASMYNNLGAFFFDTGAYEKAIQVFEIALGIYVSNKQHERAGVVYNNLGTCYSKLGQNDKANSLYQKGLKVSTNKRNLADIHSNLGDYLLTKDPLQRLPYYRKSIGLILDQEQRTTPEIPEITITKVKEVPQQYWSDLLFYLTNIARTYVDAYHFHSNDEYLIDAKRTLYLIDELVALIREDSTMERSKLFWISKGVDVYMLAVQVCYLLQDVEEGFYFMERNKALLLLENLDKNRRNYQQDVSSIDTQRALLLEQQVKDLKIKMEKSSNDVSLKREFLAVNHALQKLKDSLKIVHPALVNDRGQEMVSLSAHRAKNVHENTYFVEYILNEDRGYGLFCSENETIFFEIEHVKQLRDDIVLLKQLMSTPFKREEDFTFYQEKAYPIFKSLFPFKNAFKVINNKRLAIVPDDVLHGFPFAALVVHPKREEIDLDYLLFHTDIHYLHSAAVYNRLENDQSNGRVVGFAPTVFKAYNMPDLLGSKVGMEAYESFLPMTVKLKEKATKQEFLADLTKNNSIIHVNSHAGVHTDGEPWLALFDDTVSLEEIYSLEIKSKHVVLDACQTALGEHIGGEGIMSLSRALFYSGVESVVAAQWNINEQSNNEILQRYYRLLKEGKTKSQALNDAKRFYMSHSELVESSPYHWAALTLTGTADTVFFQSNSTIWILLSSMVALGILFVGWKIAKKHS